MTDVTDLGGHRQDAPLLDSIIRKIPAGSSVLLPPACGTSAGIGHALALDSERLNGSRIWSGLLLEGYPFLEEYHRDRFRYGTWHVSPTISNLVHAGIVGSYPIKASQVIDFVRSVGADDVVVVQVSTPDKDGYCSLGLSGGYPNAAARSAGMLIAHVNPAVPYVHGDCRIKLSDAAVAVTHEQEPIHYLAPPRGEIPALIAKWIEPLIPNGATLQVGLGSVPEAVLESLPESGRTGLTIWGMATDGVVSVDEAGMLRRDGRPAVVAHEVMGTQRLYEWVDCNERVKLVDYDVVASVEEISRIPDFISVNSAIEIDLAGNVNSEVLRGRQISGVGGGLDFADGARRSPGGISILALPSTARGGQVSRIVPRLDQVPHSLSRTTVQYVVTEHGVADLSLLSLHQRAEALVGLAAPEFRDELWQEHERLWR